MSSISIPSELLLFVKNFERKVGKTKQVAFLPCPWSVYRYLWHLPGSLGCYEKHHFHRDLAWVERCRFKGEALWSRMLQTEFREKARDLVMRKSFKPQVGFSHCCQGGDANAVISLDSSFKYRRKHASWQRWNLLHDRSICGLLILDNWKASNIAFMLPEASGHRGFWVFLCFFGLFVL